MPLLWCRCAGAVLGWPAAMRCVCGCRWLAGCSCTLLICSPRLDMATPSCIPSLAGNASSLAFIGHSQGTTQTFAALASRPELRSRLSFAAMLAPAVQMRHIRSYPLQVLAAMDADRVSGRLAADRAGGMQGLIAQAWLHEAPAALCDMLLCGAWLDLPPKLTWRQT